MFVPLAILTSVTGRLEDTSDAYHDFNWVPRYIRICIVASLVDLTEFRIFIIDVCPLWP